MLELANLAADEHRESDAVAHYGRIRTESSNAAVARLAELNLGLLNMRQFRYVPAREMFSARRRSRIER